MTTQATNGTPTRNLYLVTIISVLDRPEMRCPSFPSLPSGSYLRDEIVCETRAAAISHHEDVLAGEYDFASEYAVTVDVAILSSATRWQRSGSRSLRRRQRRTGRDGAWSLER
jgi:hypothetical protein